MDLWEFMACVDGYALSKGAKKRGPELSDEALAEMGIVGFDGD